MELLPNGSPEERNHIVPYDDSSLFFEKPRYAHLTQDAPAEEMGPQINVGLLVRKYWLLAVLLLILGAAGGFASVVLSSPSYRAHLLLEVQNSSTSFARNGSSNNDNGDTSEVGIQTQINILRSGTFLQRGAERLQQDQVPLAPTGRDIFARLRQRIHPTIQDPLENARQGLNVAMLSFDAKPVNRTRLIE